ncbi:acetylserotonin O-methyltransferase [Phocoena sinus]|uniref:acetylserotonin O-methyltransferase n=1 Tax=Phocoena sinus TaxID=42100 RepID=UPI0013C52D04|nr:acetylserotonin O-methyltransferase [Phocoena sinus]
MAAVSTVAWSADTEVLLAGVRGGKRRATTAGQVRTEPLAVPSACSETCDSRNRDDWGPPSQAGLEGRRVPPGEENCGLLEEYSSAFVVTQVLFAACELGVFDLLAEVLEALGSAAVAAPLGVSSRGTELLLDACVSLKLLQVEVRREKGPHTAKKKKKKKNTELASTYLARASPKSQQDMLLYTARTTYLGWGHLAAAVRDRRNQYLKAFGVPSEELFTAIYRCHSSVVMLAGMRRKAGHTCTLDTGKLPEQTQDWETPQLPPDPVLPSHRGGTESTGRPSGGSGAVAKACMSLYPGSQITVFDILDVVQMAKRHFSFPEDERIGLCEGDFFEDCLPEPDLCILARVPHDWTGEKCSHLLVRTYQACKTDTW